MQKRKGHLDIDALLRQRISLSMVLAAGTVVYGRGFNPLIALKALSYFDDVPTLPTEVQARLGAAVISVDVTKLPAPTPYVKRPNS